MGWKELFARTPSVRAEAARALVQDGALLLDVREGTEWNAGHAPHARHLPLGRIAEAPRQLRSGQRLVVACRSGNRSRLATTRLRAMGFDAVNLSGGMHAWVQAGGSLVDRGGRAGRVA
jgi:rhodanese-related sulfurtransferase